MSKVSQVTLECVKESELETFKQDLQESFSMYNVIFL